jgi:putative inorganic carbon (HCO3(-)) transporter
LGTGIGHYIPLVAYLGFWVMIIASLGGKPLYGLYYMLPFLPYRTMRDHFLDYPLGANVLTILVVSVILGALFRGKRLPKSKLYVTWLIYGIFLYFSMWMGGAMGYAPLPIWLSNQNFVTWKDYILIPLVFMAASLVIEDRKAVRTVVILVAVSLMFIDRSSLLESLSRNWANFDENKRDGGPLGFGSNQTAAFTAQFLMFVWGVAQFVKRKKFKILFYVLVAVSMIATMYTFSRGAYLAILASVLVLGFLKDRKLLIVLGVFLLTWQTIVPDAVRERVSMTKTANGQLEASAQERVDLWTNAEQSFLRDPIFGNGYATFQFGEHVAGLSDTHNWYVKVLVETGLVGFVIALFLVGQTFVVAFSVFRKSTDPLYKGLGLGLFLALCSCVISNCFGDRWTYLEITGLLWVLIAAAIRAREFSNREAPAEIGEAATPAQVNQYLAYR